MSERDSYIDGYLEGLRKRVDGLEAKIKGLEDENKELIQALLVEIMERPSTPWPALPPYPPQWPDLLSCPYQPFRCRLDEYE